LRILSLHITALYQPQARRIGATAALVALAGVRVQGAGNFGIPECWKGKKNSENGTKVAHATIWFLKTENKLFVKLSHP
jgi:hypothetical protein